MRAALALVLSGATVASAAELPTKLRDPKHEAPKARYCEIGGARGVWLEGGTCVRVGGYVSGSVGAGKLRH